MAPTQNTTDAATTNVLRWNSPLPYIFGGLALMLGVIACALMILACSYKKPYSSSNPSNNIHTVRDQVKPSLPEFRTKMSPEMEAKIVIVMPGDINPSYLAQPVPSDIPHPEQV